MLDISKTQLLAKDVGYNTIFAENVEYNKTAFSGCCHHVEYNTTACR